MMNPKTSGWLGKTFLVNTLDLLVLCCLAIAQPVFELLGNNTEFLAARNMDAKEIYLLTAVLVLLIPVLLGVLEFFVRLISRRIYDYFHRFVLTILVLLLLLPSMKAFYKMLGNFWILVPLVLAGVLVEVYMRMRARGLALAYLSPIILLLPGLFLFHSPVRSIVYARQPHAMTYPAVDATAPIVMIVFDELPLTSLLNDRGEINWLRYPNIARFANKATWYRNASTVASDTLYALPAILDGNMPDPDDRSLPLAKDHPHSVFTLLGRSYRLNVVENYTHLCPEDLCGPGAIESTEFKHLPSLLSDIGVMYLYIQLPAALTQSLPDITQSWKKFTVARTKNISQLENPDDFNRAMSFEGRDAIFSRFVASILPDSKPSLNFLHILLPHVPWEYLPSGKRHSLREKNIRGLMGINDEGIDSNLWKNDPWAILQAQKRHLLQVEFVDRLVGDLVDHLRKTELFDKSLIVITADHGTCFRPEVSRRTPTRESYADIMAIPLFIKSPHQKNGIVSDAVMESIDIFPTMADILGIRLPWKTDGRSALDLHAPLKTMRTPILQDGRRMPVGSELSDVYESVHKKISQFGYAPDDLFRVGPHKELVGQRPANLKVTRSSVRCFLEGRSYYENVDLNAPILLANIKGALEGDRPSLALPLNLAIAINGKIAGVTQAYADPENRVKFSLVVSDSNFRNGANRVQIYLISEKSSGIELAETEDAGIPFYRWGDKVTFGAAGNAHVYRMRGWGNPEEEITWTDGRIAELVLPIRPAQGPVRLQLFAGAYLKPGILNKQRVKLSVNGQPIADWIITRHDFEIREAVLPADLIRNSSSLAVTFELPDATSPSDIAEGEDLRRLGLAISWLSFSQMQQSSP